MSKVWTDGKTFAFSSKQPKNMKSVDCDYENCRKQATNMGVSRFTSETGKWCDPHCFDDPPEEEDGEETNTEAGADEE